MLDPEDNANLVRASELVEELVASGADRFSISPGSRSTPLALAISRNERAHATVHFDERGAAYFALGIARATRRPAVWVTTSGTAVANGFPAVIEADRDEVPMVCLTADRPPELRDVGANQTIDQVKIFGDAVRWFFDLPCPGEVPSGRLFRSVAGHAVYRAYAERGPVHLNVMFREPLSGEMPQNKASFQQGVPGCDYVDGATEVHPELVARIMPHLMSGKRGLVIAGHLETAGDGAAVRALAERLGWPLLPDIRSGLRLAERDAPVITYYDVLLVSPGFRELLSPEVVLSFGRRPLSKRLNLYLRDKRPEVFVQVHRGLRRSDPGLVVTQRVRGQPAGIARALAERLPVPRKPDSRLSSLVSFNRAAHDAVQTLVEKKEAELSEIGVVRHVLGNVPPEQVLFLGNSLPVRHADMFAPAGASGIRVFANRGASGIDGNIATAAGIAAGTGRPVTAIVGDLTALHDMSSLAYLQRSPLTLVVINNHGGGIFRRLEVQHQEDVFESFFVTPQEISIGGLASAFGIDYRKPNSIGQFREMYHRAASSEVATVIEVDTSQDATTSLHARMLAAILTLDQKAT